MSTVIVTKPFESHREKDGDKPRQHRPGETISLPFVMAQEYVAQGLVRFPGDAPPPTITPAVSQTTSTSAVPAADKKK